MEIIVRIGNMRKLSIYCLILAGILCASPVAAQQFDGMASYYGPGFHGRRAADGSIYNMYQFTCAHKKLPFGTRLKVTNKKNGKSIVVTVTDRGPYVKGRIVDLSVAAAKEIDMLRSGVAPVTIEVLKEHKPMVAEALKIKPAILDIKDNLKIDIKRMDVKSEFPNLSLDHQVS